MYNILLAREAEKQLKALDPRYQKAVTQALRRLATNPSLGAPLRHELKGLWRLRVASLRIIYQINHASKTIWILTIEYRKEVYR